MESLTGGSSPALCLYGTLRTCFPILTWLPRYNLTWLKMDLIAGLTVGLTVVPQALAYAAVAGLPVQVRTCGVCTSLFFYRSRNLQLYDMWCCFVLQYGLYSAFMGGFIYCIFGSSKDITLGPTAIMSLLCSSYIDGDPVFAVVLTLLCGVIQAGMALLRLGKIGFSHWLKNFLSVFTVYLVMLLKYMYMWGFYGHVYKSLIRCKSYAHLTHLSYSILNTNSYNFDSIQL